MQKTLRLMAPLRRDDTMGLFCSVLEETILNRRTIMFYTPFIIIFMPWNKYFKL